MPCPVHRRYRRGGSVFQVIGVGDNGDRPVPVLGHRLHRDPLLPPSGGYRASPASPALAAINPGSNPDGLPPGVGCGLVLTRVIATRYVTPLREGGSLPAVMEADDLGTYVVKFRGAGQGRKALIAEIISAGLARACGLPVPDLVTVEVDPAMAPGEPDQEIQDLLRASSGAEPRGGLPAGCAGLRDRRRNRGTRPGRPDHVV